MVDAMAKKRSCIPQECEFNFYCRCKDPFDERSYKSFISILLALNLQLSPGGMTNVKSI